MYLCSKGESTPSSKTIEVSVLIIDYRKQFIDANDRATVTKTLIGINLTVWIAMMLLKFMKGLDEHTLLTAMGMKVNELIIQGQYWRLFTAMFLHLGPLHLFSNLYALYVYGPTVEKYFGGIKFLLIYIISGILGNLSSYLFLPNPSAGASGAIFGLVGALFYFRKERRHIFNWAFGPRLVILLIFNIALGFTTSLVDNMAHIGGLVGGYLIANGLGLSSELKKKVFKKICIWILTLFIFGLGLSYGTVKYLDLGHLHSAYNAVENNEIEDAKGYIAQLSEKDLQKPNVKELIEYIYIEDMRTNIENGDMIEALHSINTLIEYSPDDLFYYYRGYIYEVMGNWTMAYADYLYAADSIQDDEDIWYSVARVTYNLGQFDKTKTYLDKVLALNQNNIDAKELLDYISAF